VPTGVDEQLLRGATHHLDGRCVLGRVTAGRQGEVAAQHPVRLGERAYGGLGVGVGAPQRGDRTPGLVHAGGREIPGPCGPRPGVPGAVGLQLGVHRVELHHQTAQGVREHVVQVPGDPRALLERRGPGTLVLDGDGVLQRGALRLLPASGAAPGQAGERDQREHRGQADGQLDRRIADQHADPEGERPHQRCPDRDRPGAPRVRQHRQQGGDQRGAAEPVGAGRRQPAREQHHQQHRVVGPAGDRREQGAQQQDRGAEQPERGHQAVTGPGDPADEQHSGAQGDRGEQHPAGGARPGRGGVGGHAAHCHDRTGRPPVRASRTVERAARLVASSSAISPLAEASARPWLWL
jgi:hypothetical protein